LPSESIANVIPVQAVKRFAGEIVATVSAVPTFTVSRLLAAS
jgi:hypothetical protein